MTDDFKLGRYRHYKGNEYLALCTARHSETLEECVVYKALYGDGGVWVRPLDMFCENVDTADGTVPRFCYLGE